MEALVILFAEFLGLSIIAAASAAASILAALFSGVMELILNLFGSKKDTSKKTPSQSGQAAQNEQPETPPQKSKPVWLFKWLKRASIAVLAIVTISLLAINFVFFEPTAKWVFAKVQARTGINISATKIAGNLFTGHLELTGLATHRTGTEKSGFNLKVKKVSAKVAMTSLLFGTTTLEKVAISGVSGHFEYKKKIKGTGKIKTKRVFNINDLQINDVDLQLLNRDNQALKLSLSKVASKPLRSNFAIFDLFFRSNISGTLAGQKIEISSNKTTSGRNTRWRIDRLPVEILSHFSDTSIIGWFKQGTIDINVKDSWELSDSAKINMDWRLVLNGVKVRIPKSARLRQKALFTPAALYINKREKPINLSFSLVMNENEFKGAASLEATNFWKIVKESAIKTLILKAGRGAKPTLHDDTGTNNPTEKKPGITDRTIGRFKNFLNKKRKKPANAD